MQLINRVHLPFHLPLSWWFPVAAAISLTMTLVVVQAAGPAMFSIMCLIPLGAFFSGVRWSVRRASSSARNGSAAPRVSDAEIELVVERVLTRKMSQKRKRDEV